MAKADAIDIPVTALDFSEDVRFQALEGGQTYLVTVPVDTSPAELRATRDALRRWMDGQANPPHLVLVRADIPVEPLPEQERCPHCGAEKPA